MNADASSYLAALTTLRALIPELIVLSVATIVMTAGPFVKQPRRVWSATAFFTLVVAALALYGVHNITPDPYSSVLLNDAFSGWTRMGFLMAGLVIVLLAHDQVDDARSPEFFGGLMMLHAGAMLVGSANDLVLLFVGLELVSMPTYLLLYLTRRNATTQEASAKYFFLSVFSSGLLLFGLAYLYGIAGVSNLKALSYLCHHLAYVPNPTLGIIAIVFVMAGLGFRVAAVPFHFYAPDVYEASPTIVAALLAWIPKGVGFAAMLRAVTAVFAETEALSQRGAILVYLIAIATMTVGNMLALRQTNLKRLLAYSSIAHAGYLLIGVVAAFRNLPYSPGVTSQATPLVLGAEGVLLYLMTYSLMTLGAFGTIILLSTPERPVESIEDLDGLAKYQPVPALFLALCLFSLAGVPPLAGFWGKLWVFWSALGATSPRSDESGPGLMMSLVIFGGLNAAIGAYYYLRLVVAMYLRPAPEVRLTPRNAWPTALAVGGCATLSLFLGCYPRPLKEASREAGVAAITQPVPSPVSSAPEHPGAEHTALAH